MDLWAKPNTQVHQNLDVKTLVRVLYVSFKYLAVECSLWLLKHLLGIQKQWVQILSVGKKNAIIRSKNTGGVLEI